MKILHINTEKAWRGGERQTLYLLDGLRALGIESHLVCQPGSALAKRAESAGFAVWPIAMHGEADPRASIALRRLVKRNGCDLVHSHTSHAHTLGYWSTAGLATVRLVTRRVEYSIYRNSFFGLNRFKYRFMAHAYIAISDRIRRVMVSDGVPEQMIRVVPSGVLLDPVRSDPQRLMAEFGLGREHRVLLSVAHLTPEKGHDVLLRAMKRVVDRVPSARLVVVGDGGCRSGLEALAQRSGIRQAVLFVGFRDDVADFYGLAEVFVSSSTAEGLGSSVLDALAAGVPVVATAVGGIPEVVVNGETGILVPPSQPQALARGIVEQLERAGRAREMAGRGCDLVRKRFSVQKMVSGTLQVYRELLSGPRTPAAAQRRKGGIAGGR